MTQKNKINTNHKDRFIPHIVAIKRVKDSFERSKKKQTGGSDKFVEVK